MRRAAALIPALALAACASLPPAAPRDSDCRANYLGLDARVSAADVRNGGAHRIEGFPYLRADRFLASFRDAADGPAFDAWVERLRQLDLQARTAELRNLGWADPSEELAHLDRCSRDWSAHDLQDPARRAQLRERAQVPDDYSLLKRALGLYPLAVPFLNMGIRSYNADVHEDYARPLGEGIPLTLWSPPAGAPSGAIAIARDALGIPQLGADQWHALATTHAPHWLVETTGDFDRLGTPVLRDGKPALDTARPVTHFLPAYTRFGGKVLVQLVYVAWFSERPKDGWLDSYSGTLDGVVWRVTLDESGQPLLYDTIHACGCYHYYYLAQPLPRKEQGGFWQEPVLFPQEAPAEPFAIRLATRTHYVRRLVPLESVVGAPSGATVRAIAPEGAPTGGRVVAGAAARRDEPNTYAIADYTELLSLPDGKGGARSLFCEDGIACGTERFERFWLWPAGIKSAGAMRQWGRHATSFVGRTHFDDPGMMDRLFVAPAR